MGSCQRLVAGKTLPHCTTSDCNHDVGFLGAVKEDTHVHVRADLINLYTHGLLHMSFSSCASLLYVLTKERGLASACRWHQHLSELLLVAVALTDKEAVLFLTRLAALDNVMLAVGPSREQWQKTFLDLLYTMCTKVVPPHVSCSDC